MQVFTWLSSIAIIHKSSEAVSHEKRQKASGNLSKQQISKTTRKRFIWLTWESINTFTRLFSFIGPNLNKKKFKIVRLLASRILPVFGCTVSSVSPSVDSVRRTKAEIFDGGPSSNIVFEGCKRLVFGSNLWCAWATALQVRGSAYLGTLCRGQGTSPNSCGQESRKLKICGMKNSSKVFEKCAWIPTTANAIPVT